MKEEYTYTNHQIRMMDSALDTIDKIFKGLLLHESGDYFLTAREHHALYMEIHFLRERITMAMEANDIDPWN